MHINYHPKSKVSFNEQWTMQMRCEIYEWKWTNFLIQFRFRTMNFTLNVASKFRTTKNWRKLWKLKENFILGAYPLCMSWFFDRAADFSRRKKLWYSQERKSIFNGMIDAMRMLALFHSTKWSRNIYLNLYIVLKKLHHLLNVVDDISLPKWIQRLLHYTTFRQNLIERVSFAKFMNSIFLRIFIGRWSWVTMHCMLLAHFSDVKLFCVFITNHWQFTIKLIVYSNFTLNTHCFFDEKKNFLVLRRNSSI